MTLIELSQTDLRYTPSTMLLDQSHSTYEESVDLRLSERLQVMLLAYHLFTSDAMSMM